MICGAAGGIGSAMLEHLLADEAVAMVIATHRHPLSSVHTKLTWLTLDFAHTEEIASAAAQIAARVERVDYWICATGVLSSGAMTPEKSLQQLASENLTHSLQVNAAGPLLFFAACAGLLQAARAPKVMFLSAQVGSIEDNHLGGWYSYRMAKAALNMGVKTAAIEAGRWRTKPVIVAVHPGTTHSSLSKPFTRRRTQRVRGADETGEALYSLLKQLSAEKHGKFLTNVGDELPW